MTTSTATAPPETTVAAEIADPASGIAQRRIMALQHETVATALQTYCELDEPLARVTLAAAVLEMSQELAALAAQLKQAADCHLD